MMEEPLYVVVKPTKTYSASRKTDRGRSSSFLSNFIPARHNLDHVTDQVCDAVMDRSRMRTYSANKRKDREECSTSWTSSTNYKFNTTKIKMEVAAMMNELSDPSNVVVKLEPEDTEDIDTADITIEHNVTTATSIQPLAQFLLEPTPDIEDNIDLPLDDIVSASITTSYCTDYYRKVDSTVLSDPFPSLPKSNGIRTEDDNVVNYHFEPKKEVFDSPQETSETNAVEFKIDPDFVGSELEPSLHERNSIYHPLNQSLSTENKPKIKIFKVLSGETERKPKYSTTITVTRHMIPKTMISSLKPPNDVSVFACRTCGKCYRNGRALATHQRTHPERLTLEDCQRKDNLNTQVATSSSSKTSKVIFLCPICRLALTSNVTLEEHVKSHGGVVKCEHCQRYYSEDRLRNHILVRHSRRYTCVLCRWLSDNMLSLNEHISSFHKDRIKLNFKCCFCSKCFKSSVKLETHLVSAHRQKDSRAFECWICNAKFRTSLELYRHDLIHKKPHLCKVCGVRSATKHGLLIHQVTARCVRKRKYKNRKRRV